MTRQQPPQQLHYRVTSLAAGLAKGNPVAAGARLDGAEGSTPSVLCALGGKILRIESREPDYNITIAVNDAPPSPHSDNWLPLLPPIAPATIGGHANPRELLLSRIAEAGICGLGGGRFPSAAKLAASTQTNPLIINAMQSEPDNDSDLWLVREDPTGVADGVALTAIGCAAQSVIIAIPKTNQVAEATKTQLKKALDLAFDRFDWQGECRLKTLPVNPASGAETLLARAAAGLAVGLHQPLHQIGALSVNLATAYAIGRAVLGGEPLLRRVVTIAGEPRWVWLGTPIVDLIDGPCMLNGRIGGKFSGDNARLADALDAVDAVDAGHFCITPIANLTSYPCINCSRCRPVCPAELHPDLLHKTLLEGLREPGVIDKANQLNVDRCIECGACNAVCPSDIFLAQQFREARSVCAHDAALASAADNAKVRVDARNARLARADEQRDAARREREQTARDW